MAKVAKIQRIPLQNVVVKMDRNVREETETTYDDPTMRDSLAMIGQQTIAKLLKIGPDLYEPIQGNRRVYNLKKLAEEGVIDPKTAKRDPETGVVLRELDAEGKPTGKPIGGRVFDSIEAEVYEGLSERERVELLVDHGSIRSLNKPELQRAAEFMFSVGYSEKEVAVQLGNLLHTHYPPSRKIVEASKDGGNDLLNYYRGVIQTMKEVYRSPIVLHDSWMDKLRTGRAWPLKSEMSQGCDIFKKELDADKTGRLSRQNPGPKFLEFWQGVVEKHQKAEASGEKRAKASSMMNHSQITDKVIDSRTLKAFRFIIFRSIPEDQLPFLDAAVVKFEAGEISKDEYSTALDAVFATLQQPETKSEETKPQTEAA